MKTKALHIIKSLTKEEKIRFKDFLESDYFTKNRTLSKLFRVINSNIEKIEKESFTEAKLHGMVFKGGVYNYNSLKNLLSELNKQAENFLVVNHIITDNLETNKILNDELIKRNLFTSLNNNYTKSVKTLESQSKRNYLYYYYKFQFDSAALKSSYSSKPESFVYSDKLNSVLNSFSKWLCLNTFEFYQGILGLKATHNFEIEAGNRDFFDKISEFSSKEFFSDDTVKTYKYYFELVSNNIGNYKEYKKILLNSLDKFDFWEQRAFLIVACHFTLVRIEEGKEEYYPDFHSYMELMIERKFVTTITGYLSENAFLLSIKNYCEEGEIEKAEVFYNKFNDDLVPEIRESVLNFCSAEILYYKKDFNNALKLLSMIKNEYFTLTFQASNLRLILLYETNNFENIEVIINSSLKYINSNKDAALFLKEHYKRFILLFNKVIKIKLGEPGNINSIKSEIQKTERCHYKKWLLEKISEFELL